MGPPEEQHERQPGRLLPQPDARGDAPVLRGVPPRAADGPGREAAGRADEADAELLPEGYAEHCLAKKKKKKTTPEALAVYCPSYRYVLQLLVCPDTLCF